MISIVFLGILILRMCPLICTSILLGPFGICLILVFLLMFPTRFIALIITILMDISIIGIMSLLIAALLIRVCITTILNLTAPLIKSINSVFSITKIFTNIVNRFYWKYFRI